MLKNTARALCLGLIVMAGLSSPQAQENLVGANRLVIQGATLISGTGSTPVQNAVVVIEGNRITAVGPAGQVSVPQGAEVIQAEGKFIIPGLSDMHVHWQGWMPELFLAHGVTSAVDLESGQWTHQQRDLIRDGRMRGPRIFTATNSLYGRLVWNYGESPSRPVLHSTDMARRMVRRYGPGRELYNVTKTYTELAPDHLAAIVEESHRLGRKVIGHLGGIDARQAARVGIDGIAHGAGIALASIADPVKAEELRTFVRMGIAVDFPMFLMYHAYMDPQKADELVELLVAEDVAIEFEQVNTAGRWVPEYRDAWIAEDRKYFEDPNLSYIGADHWDRIFYYEPYDQLTEREKELVQQGYDNRKEFLGKFARAGGKVLAGCDTASFVLPGICLHRELELLVEAGMSPMQAIQAATVNNFEFLQEPDLGTLEPGKLADLLILREDPLADIRNTRTIDMVIKNGQIQDTSYHSDFVNPDDRPFLVSGFINPVPHIRVLYPMSTSQLNRDLKLIIEGTGLADESMVEFDGITLKATPVKSTLIKEMMFNPVYTQLEVTVPALLLKRYGSYRVVVKNPRPQGGVSSAVTFFAAP
ncbi:MAG: amidohydrolase family protein [Acidobacteriota bacterium]